MDPYTIARLAREKEMEIRREAYKEYWDDPRVLEAMFRSGQTLTLPERALQEFVSWIRCRGRTVKQVVQKARGRGRACECC